MTIIMFVTWLVLFVLTALAFWEGKIFKSAPEDVVRDKVHLRFSEKIIRAKDSQKDLEKGEPEGPTSPDPSSLPQSETQTLHDAPVSIQQQTVDIHVENTRTV